ncbi:hypothetical protein Ga0123462_1871 [Mariprofundus ferrinatatus]|uniref:Uncharacterized protein n=1 Tax=Mariprofundus ferrinatatus TaxID=1921087 RepID=A0A2K8L644_9PROT|nr:hypothetical protein Ga0123462_1871 [Mariprofundus ferrinatatus]
MNSDPLTDNSVLILRDAARSLEAAAGEIVLLIGEVGSGKSLWLKRLAGLASSPPQFTATIAGKPPTDYGLIISHNSGTTYFQPPYSMR